MDLNLYSRLRGGQVKTFTDLPSPVADRAFNEHKKHLDIPWTAHYRVTLTDPLAGGRCVRDSDQELHGFGRISTSAGEPT